MSDKRPDVIPETCGLCVHFKKTGLLDRYRGHCSFYDRATYRNYECYGTTPAEHGDDECSDQVKSSTKEVESSEEHGYVTDTAREFSEKPFAQPHWFAMIFTVCLFAFAFRVVVAIRARGTGPSAAIADNTDLIFLVHLMMLVILLVAGAKLLNSSRRLFKSTFGKTTLVRWTVRLTSIIPAMCALFFWLLGIGGVCAFDIPSPSFDRQVGAIELEGQLADDHQESCRFVRLRSLMEALSLSIVGLLVAYLPGVIAFVVAKQQGKDAATQLDDQGCALRGPP